MEGHQADLIGSLVGELHHYNYAVGPSKELIEAFRIPMVPKIIGHVAGTTHGVLSKKIGREEPQS